ncbi:hypothetical protein METESE_27230 [Mesoterricola sediminis]|uniref:Uncharacterized protein n=2 Tax=Mesoterricola sediminis TaxID=2927980 RepID=A0AA48KE68_9BACT|nr:hypothetical protein METESE_27230 [Mesoterricola sediminis]
MFLVFSGLALLVWAAFRSRWYQERLGDLQGMRRAAGQEEDGTGLHRLDPLHQLTRPGDGPRRPRA